MEEVKTLSILLDLFVGFSRFHINCTKSAFIGFGRYRTRRYNAQSLGHTDRMAAYVVFRPAFDSGEYVKYRLATDC